MRVGALGFGLIIKPHQNLGHARSDLWFVVELGNQWLGNLRHLDVDVILDRDIDLGLGGADVATEPRQASSVWRRVLNPETATASEPSRCA